MYCKQSPGVSFVFFFCLWKTSVPAEARQATHASEAGSLRLAAPTGHKPAATTCQDGSQCASEIFFFLEMLEIWIFMGKVLGWFFLSFFPFFSVLRQGLMQPMLALNSLCSWGLPWTFEPSAFTSPVKGLQTWTLTDGLRTTEKWTLNFAHRRQLLYWATSPGLLGKMLSFAKDLFGPGWMCKTAVLQPSLGALFYCKGLWIFTLVRLFHLDSGVPCPFPPPPLSQFATSFSFFTLIPSILRMPRETLHNVCLSLCLFVSSYSLLCYSVKAKDLTHARIPGEENKVFFLSIIKRLKEHLHSD